MKQRGRARRVLKWAGTVACVLLVVMLVLSPWCWVQWRGSHGILMLFDGAVRRVLVTKQPPPGPTPPLRGWRVIPIRGRPWRSRVTDLHWVPDAFADQYDFGRGARTVVTVPLWMPLVVILPPTAFLWWRDRRYPPGHCQHCGYNLTGNVSGRCPECGTPIPQSTP